MKYGYLRVSTDAQDEENQKSGILRWLDYMQYSIDEWVIEHGVSGKKDYNKRLLGNLMKKLKQDDWLIVSEFTRLSRDIFQMYEICKILVDRGVHVYSIKDNHVLDLSADGKFRLALYAYFAEKERERISERTREALARKKAQGIKIGRPFGTAGKMLMLSNTKDYIRSLIDDGHSVKDIADRMGCCSHTISDFLKKQGWMTKSQIEFRKCHNVELMNELSAKARKEKIILLEYMQ